MFCQYLGLPDVGEVLRLIAGVVVVDLRRDVAILRGDTGEELLGAAPDGLKLRIRERRITLGGFIEEALVGLVGIAVFLNDATGKTGHGGVPASFGDDPVTIPAAAHVLIKGIGVLQKVGQVHAAFPDLHLGSGRPEKEPGCIQRLRIEIRKDGIDQFLQVAVGGRIRHEVNREQDMELRTGRLAVFLPVVETAVVDGKAHARKGSGHVVRGDPLCGIFGVVVVAIDREAVASDEVVVVAVVVLIFGAYVVVADSRFQAVRVHYIVPVGVGAVTGVAGNICAVQGNH